MERYNKGNRLLGCLNRKEKQMNQDVYKRQIQDMGKTSLVITHDYELIVSCCTYVLHLEHGEIQEQYILDEKGLQRLKEFFMETR